MKTTLQKQSRRNQVPIELKTKALSKKESILEAFHEGRRDIWKLAEEFETQPSYVASVLQTAGLINGYYDLYTTAENPMNVYVQEFQGRLGFKNSEAAEKSIELIDRTYKKLAELRDRAGQHHCLVTAMTMYNRARFIGKTKEAEIYRVWLIRHLLENEQPVEENISDVH